MHPLECAACTAAAGTTCCVLTCFICKPAKTIELSKMLCCISPASDSISSTTAPNSISSTAQTTTEERPGIDSVGVLPGFKDVVLAILDKSTPTMPITQNSESAAAASEAQSSSSRRVVRPQILVRPLDGRARISNVIDNLMKNARILLSKHCFAGVKTSLNPTEEKNALKNALAANGVNTDNITDDKLDAIQLALHLFLDEGQNIEVVLSDPSELKKIIKKYMQALRLNQVQIEFLFHAKLETLCEKLQISNTSLDSNDMQKIERNLNLKAFFIHYISKYPESLLQGLNFHINGNNAWEQDINDFLRSKQSAGTAPAPSTIDRL